MSVIVIEFITLDGIVTDPDGSGATPAYLECLSAERAGAAVLTRYGRAAR